MGCLAKLPTKPRPALYMARLCVVCTLMRIQVSCRGGSGDSDESSGAEEGAG